MAMGLPPPVLAVRACAGYCFCKFGGRKFLIAGLFVMLGLVTRLLPVLATMLVAIVVADAFLLKMVVWSFR